MKRTLVLLSILTHLHAEELPSSLSMQGFSGLINTPNAQVMHEGDIVFSFNSQFDNHLRDYDDTKPRTDTQDYVFGAGLLPGFEVQGRFKEQSDYTRDLSANFKYQIPQFHAYMPNIAIGIQDLGSAASNYENYYIVADKSYAFFRASIGYGYGKNVKRSPRMDGVFAGLEARVSPWASLLGEYDGEESHAAVRLNMPKAWSNSIRLNATIASNLSDDGHVSFMVNAVIPLQRKEKYLPDSAVNAAAKKSTTQRETSLKIIAKGDFSEGALIERLADDLRSEGLQNISISTSAERLYIGYENTVYMHNELDAMGVVLRKATALSSHYKNFVLQPKKSNVIITSYLGSLEKANDFYTHPSFESKTAFLSSLTESKNVSVEGNLRSSNENSGRFKTHLLLTPKVSTFLGTEVGAFDYQLLLGLTAYWNLYDGLDLSTRYDLPVVNSDELDPMYGIFGGSYNDGGVNSAMLHYTMNLAGGLNTLSAGLYLYDYVGVMDQFIYHSDAHTFKLKLGYFEHHDYTVYDKEVYLAKYTYNYAALDLYLEAEAGKYWHQDSGFGLSVKRYFQDVAVSLGYLQTSPEGELGFSEETNKYVGLAIEFPLDFRKSKSAGKYIQLQGDNSWRYEQRSTVAREDGSNTIVPFSGHDPMMDFESEKYLTNNNRMNVDYIQRNAERLLDTF